jgi:hypothetical protein
MRSLLRPVPAIINFLRELFNSLLHSYTVLFVVILTILTVNTSTTIYCYIGIQSIQYILFLYENLPSNVPFSQICWNLLPPQSTLVTIYTTCLNINKHFSLPTQCICMLRNKQKLVHLTQLTHRSF